MTAQARALLWGYAIWNQKAMRVYVAAVIAAGGAGALAAIAMLRGDYWLAPLVVAAAYISYRNYRVLLGDTLAYRKLQDAIRKEEGRTRAGKLEALARLAGGIAHDFNDILTAIVGNVSLVRARGWVDRESDDALAEAEQACVRARQLTEQLLTFAKGGAPVKKPLRIEPVIRQAAEMVLSGSDVRCALHVDPNVWAVNADDSQLIQVLNNILINARQAVPQGGRVVVRAENVTEPVDRWEQGLEVAAGPYVSVSIADEGDGIDPRDAAAIFDPYYATQPTGSGLGLATALSIVKSHRGYITAESKPGRGTTVRVALPAMLTATFDEHAAVSSPCAGASADGATS